MFFRYAIGFILATISCGCMMLVVNAAMLSWQEFLELPQVGLKIPLPKQCRRETIKDDEYELNKKKKSDNKVSGKSARKTLMELYGQKASAMEEQGKMNKDARRLAEEARKKRHAQGEYSDEENEMNVDDIENGNQHDGTASDKSTKKVSSYVFEGIDLNHVNHLMKQLLEETKPTCQGCEGLSTCHDEHCLLEEHQLDESGKRIVKKKMKKKYRFQREEESIEERSQRVRKHVKLSNNVSPSLSFEARRIQRLQGGTPAPETSPVVKHRVRLSQQASILQSIGGAQLFSSSKK